MLYLLHKGNHEGVTYHGGQDKIIHLVADLPRAVDWADGQGLRWAFTLSNAGSGYFEDRANLGDLSLINWAAVKAERWSGEGVGREVKEGKQAEFLVENRFPWQLVIGIGVHSQAQGEQVTRLTTGMAHKPTIKVLQNWYYL